MASKKHTDQVLKNFVFDCMDVCEINYMPSAKQLGDFDYDKYCALKRNGGVEGWKKKLMLLSKDEFEMMMKRKGRGKRCDTAVI